MKVATFTTNDGEAKALEHWDGRFTVDGDAVPLREVLAWDARSLLSWVSPETQSWARGLAAQAAHAPQGPQPKLRKIQETRYTCLACGNVWHYGKQDFAESKSAKKANTGKALLCCSGCAPALLIPTRDAIEPNKCPKCGSRACTEEVVVHEVE